MWRISYWVLPILSCFFWAATLLILLIYWLANGRPIYASMDPTQTIAYISDVGATSLKPLFIVGCCLTTIFLDLSLLSEFWLRHNGRLAENISQSQKALVWLSLVCAANGTAGLILLSVFDTLRYRQLHNIFLVVFIAGYLLSAIFICWEYQLLGKYHRQHSILRRSFWLKLGFIITELALVAVFATFSFVRDFDTAAIFEWIIALIFSLYVFSFFIDFIPSIKTRTQKGVRLANEMQHETDNELMGDRR
ncbi:Protein SFK1 [Golovinomyces cichoracearum]|uniref:Protein SFK1 n=1 Tax=Golovinomyces cichoracearum TaxID=62708 RepID=A0A420ISD5_9PEZI|nr:Protein SFK1 [Golovinomyces cichoracearum]